MSSTKGLLLNHSLKNLQYLRVSSDGEVAFGQLWQILASIQGDKMMPQLAELTLQLTCFGPTREWPPKYHGEHVRYTYTSLRKLTLFLTCLTANLVEIKAAFPHVIALELYLCQSEYAPCGEVWELWPNLEQLKLSVTWITVRKNYDAEFCGIHKEEVELLREMDDEFLRTVQIVPIRPSLLIYYAK